MIIPFIIGHKGASARAPENTVTSFETALRMGARMVEMDVRLSRDEEVVLIHDDKVNRVSNGRGKVEELTLAELKALKLKKGERIATLAEVLDRFKGKCEFNLDLKAENVGIPALDIVFERGMLSDVLFSSQAGPQLLELKLKKKDARVAFSCKNKKINMLKIAQSLKAEAVHPNKKLVNPELIEKAHSNGLAVNVWTVDRPSEMKRFIGMGVDGIITNKPDVLADVLKDYGRTPDL